MTSIEWLTQEDTQLSIDFLDNKLTLIELTLAKTKILQQARQMHKQEIIDAYYEIGRSHPDNVFCITKNAEQYYQETFVSKVKIKFTEEEWSELNNGSKGSHNS